MKGRIAAVLREKMHADMIGVNSLKKGCICFLIDWGNPAGICMFKINNRNTRTRFAFFY